LGVIKEVGWFGVPLIYWSDKAKGWAYLDGNMRGEELPDFETHVAKTDFTDKDIALSLTTYDPLAAAAATNVQALSDLLENVNSGEAGVQALLGELAEREGIIPLDIEFPEYDESIADEVEYLECPECGHKWPK